MARIVRTQDRVELSHEEIQAVLKEHIEHITGRKIEQNGKVHLDQPLGNEATCWARLEEVKDTLL